MAKPNYSFEKRQRELAKKKKQDEKDARKREARERVDESVAATVIEPPTETETVVTESSAPRVHLRKPISES